MNNSKLLRSAFALTLPIGVLLFLFMGSQWYMGQEHVDEKQRGAHVFGPIDSTNRHLLIRNNIEWVTLVPWGFQDDYDSPILTHHNGDSVMIRQSNASWLREAEQARAQGFKVFVKPHVWLNKPAEGTWRSDIFPSSEENWSLWKKCYRDLIFRYATLAEQAQVEMFCVGTELSRLSVEKPAFWRALIQEVRSMYSGKITYAANWYEEYERIPFWEDLDYIGVQAYFPLTENMYPTVEQVSTGWQRYLPTLEAVHSRHNRTILFTEMGYKSTADAAIEPWEWIEDPANLNPAFSLETQAHCYEAFFNAVWDQEWFAGIHIWKMRSDYVEGSGQPNLDFTPLGKPAEKIIAKGFE